jgi:hypothetical protein
MADGLADHRTPPRAMQLGSMLRGEGGKGNQYRQEVFSIVGTMVRHGSEPASIGLPV